MSTPMPPDDFNERQCGLWRFLISDFQVKPDEWLKQTIRLVHKTKIMDDFFAERVLDKTIKGNGILAYLDDKELKEGRLIVHPLMNIWMEFEDALKQMTSDCSDDVKTWIFVYGGSGCRGILEEVAEYIEENTESNVIEFPVAAGKEK